LQVRALNTFAFEQEELHAHHRDPVRGLQPWFSHVPEGHRGRIRGTLAIAAPRWLLGLRSRGRGIRRCRGTPWSSGASLFPGCEQFPDIDAENLARLDDSLGPPPVKWKPSFVDLGAQNGEGSCPLPSPHQLNDIYEVGLR